MDRSSGESSRAAKPRSRADRLIENDKQLIDDPVKAGAMTVVLCGSGVITIGHIVSFDRPIHASGRSDVSSRCSPAAST